MDHDEVALVRHVKNNEKALSRPHVQHLHLLVQAHRVRIHVLGLALAEERTLRCNLDYREHGSCAAVEFAAALVHNHVVDFVLEDAQLDYREELEDQFLRFSLPGLLKVFEG